MKIPRFRRKEYPEDDRPTLCLTLTSPFTLNAFFLGHIGRIADSVRVVVCLNRRESDVPVSLPPRAALLNVEIRRSIAPVHDLLALLKLWRLYLLHRFVIVMTATPKGGLLGMVGALFAGTPVRVHIFTGQVWANSLGGARMGFKFIDRIIAACATHCLVDSSSQRDFLVSEGILPEGKARVLGDGSISGVNLNKFKPDQPSRDRTRSELGIPPESTCLVYVGRMKRDKGVPDLLRAFEALRSIFDGLELILAGPDEDGLLGGQARRGVHVVGYTPNAERYMAAADIFCLPSYREGFGSVLIEAAASGLPCVASRIYGITDAVVDGETGLLHQAGDVPDIIRCITRLLRDPAECARMGENGRLRAIKKFSAARLETLFAEFVGECASAAYGRP